MGGSTQSTPQQNPPPRPTEPAVVTRTIRKRPVPPSRKQEWSEFLDFYFDDERFYIVVLENDHVSVTFHRTHEFILDFSNGVGAKVNYHGNQSYIDSGTVTEIVEQITSPIMDDEQQHEMLPEEEERDRPEDDQDLLLELSNFKIMFGGEYFSSTPFYSMRTLEVQLKLPPLDLIRITTAQAWGVDPKTPLIIKLDLIYENYYSNTKPPKIEVFQMDKGIKKKIKLGVQMQNLLTLFANYHWPRMSTHRVKILREEDKGKYRTLEEPPKPTAPEVPSKTTEEQKQKLKQLTDMGFDRTGAANALTHVNSVEGPSSCDFQPQSLEVTTKKPKGVQSLIVSQNTSKLSRSGNKKTAPKLDALFKGEGGFKSESDEVKLQCSADYGFLCMVMAYARRRLPSLNNFCVICDKPHVFTTGSMLKPAVCSRELCCWAFQQLGVGSEAAGEIATEAEVVDLLVCMAKVCARSQRRELIFEPFPQVYDPEKPDKLILDPKYPDWNLLVSTIDSIPSLQQLTQADDFGSMKDLMGKNNKMAFPMLQWIISSNRSHIVQLPTNIIIKGMVTPFQYLLLSDSPEKEEKFKQYKKEYGTVFAFHGSSIENWHGIMRKGLINASGSRLQVNGAAYGSGIYLSPAASTSFGYCAMGSYTGDVPRQSKDRRFLNTSGSLGCIAICEVIDKDIKKSSDIWVHPHTDMVCTRFFFVYPGQRVGSATGYRTDRKKNRQKIVASLEMTKYPEILGNTGKTFFVNLYCVDVMSATVVLNLIETKEENTLHDSETGLMVHEEVEIEDFVFDEEKQTFFYPCPCGDKFLITMDQIFDGEKIARCPSCSLLVKVIYDPADFIEETIDEELVIC